MFLQFACCCYSPALLPVAAVFGHSRYSVLFSAIQCFVFWGRILQYYREITNNKTKHLVTV